MCRSCPAIVDVSQEASTDIGLVGNNIGMFTIHSINGMLPGAVIDKGASSKQDAYAPTYALYADLQREIGLPKGWIRPLSSASWALPTARPDLWAMVWFGWIVSRVVSRVRQSNLYMGRWNHRAQTHLSEFCKDPRKQSIYIILSQCNHNIGWDWLSRARDNPSDNLMHIVQLAHNTVGRRTAVRSADLLRLWTWRAGKIVEGKDENEMKCAKDAWWEQSVGTGIYWIRAWRYHSLVLLDCRQYCCRRAYASWDTSIYDGYKHRLDLFY